MPLYLKNQVSCDHIKVLANNSGLTSLTDVVVTIVLTLEESDLNYA